MAGKLNEILLEDITCPSCSGTGIEGTCREHGVVEVATIAAAGLCCNEWLYTQGKACHKKLEVCCKECGEEEIII